MTAMIEGSVKQLKERPGEWAQVRWAVDKGAASARPFERRGCITQVVHNPGDYTLFDIWAMWPYVEQADGTLVEFVPPTAF
jgi:muconolactone delta-isomerase